MYRFSIYLLLTSLMFSCKENIKSSKKYSSNEELKITSENKANFTYQNLIGKTFYKYEIKEGKEYVIDRSPISTVQKIRFKKDRVENYFPIEWSDYYIKNQAYDNEGYLILYFKNEEEDSNKPIKVLYDKETGKLIKKSMKKNGFYGYYIDSLKLFAKNSVYEYIVKKAEVERIDTNFEDYKKNNSYTSSNEVLTEKEWVGNKAILKSITGDLNKDGVEDRFICIVPKSKIDEKTIIETLVLLGTEKKDRYNLYLKSDKIIPCQYCELDNVTFTDNSFYLSKIDNGKLIFGTTSEHTEYLFEFLEFEFKFNNQNKLVLTKLTREFESRDDIHNIDLPNTEVNLKEFDVYYFINRSLEGLN